MNEIQLFYEHVDLASDAIKLAQRFGFQLHSSKEQTQSTFLYLTYEGLQFCTASMKPWKIDFLSAERQYRRHHGGSETLARACGIKKGHKPLTIIDATAGYGKDAFVLACFGARVILLERHPIMAALLDDAIKRFYEHPIFSQHIDLKLYFDDATHFFQYQLSTVLPDLPDVIYLDPMHPQRQKSAQVKKEMALLKQWIPPEDYPEKLIKLSLSYTKDRVVLKWPKKAPLFTCPQSSFMYEEKTVRFEVFKPVKTVSV